MTKPKLARAASLFLAGVLVLLGLALPGGCSSRTKVRVDARPAGTTGREIAPTPAIDTTPAPYATPIPDTTPVAAKTPPGDPTPRFLLTPQFAATPEGETTPSTGTGLPPRPTYTP